MLTESTHHISTTNVDTAGRSAGALAVDLEDLLGGPDGQSDSVAPTVERRDQEHNEWIEYIQEMSKDGLRELLSAAESKQDIKQQLFKARKQIEAMVVQQKLLDANLEGKQKMIARNEAKVGKLAAACNALTQEKCGLWAENDDLTADYNDLLDRHNSLLAELNEHKVAEPSNTSAPESSKSIRHSMCQTESAESQIHEDYTAQVTTLQQKVAEMTKLQQEMATQHRAEVARLRQEIATQHSADMVHTMKVQEEMVTQQEEMATQHRAEVASANQIAALAAQGLDSALQDLGRARQQHSSEIAALNAAVAEYERTVTCAELRANAEARRADKVQQELDGRDAEIVEYEQSCASLKAHPSSPAADDDGALEAKAQAVKDSVSSLVGSCIALLVQLAAGTSSFDDLKVTFKHHMNFIDNVDATKEQFCLLLNGSGSASQVCTLTEETQWPMAQWPMEKHAQQLGLQATLAAAKDAVELDDQQILARFNAIGVGDNGGDLATIDNVVTWNGAVLTAAIPAKRAFVDAVLEKVKASIQGKAGEIARTKDASWTAICNPGAAPRALLPSPAPPPYGRSAGSDRSRRHRNHFASTPAYTGQATGPDSIAVLEKTLAASTKSKKDQIDRATAQWQEAVARASTMTATETLNRKGALAAIWGVAEVDAQWLQMSTNLEQKLKPCGLRCCSNHNAGELDAFRELFRNNSAWVNELEGRNETFRLHFRVANDAQARGKARIASLRELKKVGGQLHSCTAYAEELQRIVDVFRKAAITSAKAGKPQNLNMLYEAPGTIPGDLGPKPNWAKGGFLAAISSWFGFGGNAQQSEPDVQQSAPAHQVPPEPAHVPAYEPTPISLADCARYVKGMEENSAPEELEDVVPYQSAKQELPSLHWLETILPALDREDAEGIAISLAAFPSSSPPARPDTAEKVADAKARAWQTLPMLVASRCKVAVDANDRNELHLLRTTVVAPVLTLPKLAGSPSKALSRTRLQTLQVAMEEAELALGVATTIVTGSDVRCTVTLTPEEAKFGCTVPSDRLGGLTSIVIAQNTLALCTPSTRIETLGGGLMDCTAIAAMDLASLASPSRGVQVVVVTVAGFVPHDHAAVPAEAVLIGLHETGCKPTSAAEKSKEIPGGVGVICEMKEVVGTRNPLHAGGGSSSGAGAASASTAVLSTAVLTELAPKPAVDTDAKVAAYDAVLTGICEFKPIEKLQVTFCNVIGVANDAESFKTAFLKVQKRGFLKGEYRNTDRQAGGGGGDTEKYAFALTFVKNLLFPSADEDEGPGKLSARQMRVAYTDLCLRMKVPRPRLKQLGSAEPYREDVEHTIRLFTNPNIVPLPKNLEVEELSSVADFTGEGKPKTNHTKVLKGQGTPHPEYPWNGDANVKVRVVNDVTAVFNSVEVNLPTMTECGGRMWDLKLEHKLSSYESCAGILSIVLEHPDGNTYHLSARASKDGYFGPGKHIFLLSRLGLSKRKGQASRGDLYIVLESGVEVPAQGGRLD